MRHGIEPICASGIAGDENEIACARTLRGPFEVILRMNRLIVFVNTEQREIEIVARIFEVVRVTAEERNLKLRREHQTHVGVLLIGVEVVLAALIKRNHVVTHSVFLRGFFRDVVDFRVARGGSLRRCHIRLHRAGDASRYVFDRDQLIQLQIGGLNFFVARRSIEAVLDVVLL